MRDTPADDGRSRDGDDAAAADCDSETGTAQHGWEKLGDVGVADAPEPAEGGNGDRAEDQVSVQRMGGGGQDG